MPPSLSVVIADVFPDAWEALLSARAARTEMIDYWAELLEHELFEESVATDPDGRGTITAWANWPDRSRARLTEQFRRIVDQLWTCLDSLVADTISRHSNRRRMTSPTQERYFAVAPSWDDMNLLLSTGCMDGLREDLFHLVVSCQRFMDETEVDDDAGPGTIDGWQELSIMRAAVGQLVEWSYQLDKGACVGAWATPVEPQIHVDLPLTVTSLEPKPPGPVESSFEVAQYTVRDYDFRAPLYGQAGTYIDVALCEGFVPVDQHDTLSVRVNAVFEGVLLIAAQFAHLEQRTSGIAALVRGTESVAWSDATSSNHDWSPLELAALSAAELPLGVLRDAEELTLIVRTERGVYERVVPSASPLNRFAKRGTAAENATLAAAATWGLPDFVLRPAVEVKGSGVREISDGLLLCGAAGVILQSKSREGEPQAPSREHAWVNKQLRKAVKQLNGTHRRLLHGPFSLRNGRGREILVHGDRHAWMGVVVVDHPQPLSECRLELPPSKLPYVVVTRGEWEFLFDQLKSTTAVVDYLHRVGESHSQLGEEAFRYYELADADVTTAPPDFDPANLAGLTRFSAPRLPQAPAGSDDPEAFQMLRQILEDVAMTAWSTDSEGDRLTILAAIDSLPVAQRENIGRFLLDNLATNVNAPDDVVQFQSRTVVPNDGGPQLGFVVASRHDETVQEALSNWLLLRHSERQGVADWNDAISAAVILTPRGDRRRRWDTTVVGVRGQVDLDEAFLTAAHRLWGSRDLAARR